MVNPTKEIVETAYKIVRDFYCGDMKIFIRDQMAFEYFASVKMFGASTSAKPLR